MCYSAIVFSFELFNYKTAFTATLARAAYAVCILFTLLLCALLRIHGCKFWPARASIASSRLRMVSAPPQPCPQGSSLLAGSTVYALSELITAVGTLLPPAPVGERLLATNCEFFNHQGLSKQKSGSYTAPMLLREQAGSTGSRLSRRIALKFFNGAFHYFINDAVVGSAKVHPIANFLRKKLLYNEEDAGNHHWFLEDVHALNANAA